MEPMNNNIKDVSGAKLLPTTVLVHCVCFCHSTAAFVIMESVTHLWLSTIHSLIHATCYIAVTVREVAQNSGMVNLQY